MEKKGERKWEKVVGKKNCGKVEKKIEKVKENERTNEKRKRKTLLRNDETRDDGKQLLKRGK